jgi:Calx-beta domain
MRMSGIGVSSWTAQCKRSLSQSAAKHFSAALFTLCALSSIGSSAYGQIEGYGVATTGGTGRPVCTVTTSAESGAGSLDSCLNRGGNQTIQFAVPTAKVLFTQYLQSNTTIDGCANGQNGVTLDLPADTHRSLIVQGPATNVIVRCIRFQGTGKYLPNAFIEFDLLAIDGTGGAVSKVVVDRCTFTGATDGTVDIVGNVTDVTVQWSLFYNNPLTQLVKYGTRQRISLHHNVYTGNSERNPQIKGDARSIDFVSNIVYQNVKIFDPESGVFFNDPYGTKLWNANNSSDSPGNVSGNFRSNAWMGTYAELSIDTDPGASAAGIYLSGNYCNPGPCVASPAATPLAVPAANVVTATAPTSMKTQMLPTVGSPNRTAAEQARIDAIAAALPSSCTPTSPPQISVGDQAVSEGNSGTKLMTFAVTLSAASNCPVSASYGTANGTATAGADYDPATGSLLFPVGSTSQTVTVSIRGDKVFEGDEYYLVTLAGPSGGTIGDGQAVGTIVNDDAAGFSVNDMSVVEPVSGTTTASFTVTLSPTVAGITSVGYATANGTAGAPGDYLAKSGTLSFAAGAATQPVSIVVNADGLREALETFTVNLSNPTGAPIGSPSGTGSIYDPGAFFTVPPCRVVDTRGATVASGLGGPALLANVTRTFTLAGSCGIPANARAIALNITVTGATRAGDLRIFPGGSALPPASAINYVANQTRANNLVVSVTVPGQTLAVRCDQAAGTVNLIIDLAGYIF